MGPARHRVDEQAEFAARLVADGRARVAIVEVQGEIDLFTMPAFATTVREAEDASGAVLIDLAGATFIDSKGLTVLLEAQRRALADGRRLAVVCAPDGAVRRALELCGIERCVAVRPSRADALAGLADG